MSKINNLLRRGGRYSARLRVPLDLVPVIGKSELVKALGTADPAEAKRLVRGVIDAWNREFDQLRIRRDFGEDDAAHAAVEAYAAALDRDEAARQALPSRDELDTATAKLLRRAERGEITSTDPLDILNVSLDVQVMRNRAQLDRRAREVRLTALRTSLATGETALIEHEVDDFLARHRITAPRGTPGRRTLARAVLRAEIEAMQRGLERDTGDYSGAPRDPILKPIPGKTREAAKPGETIEELFETYVTANPNGVTKDSLDQARRSLGLFGEIVSPRSAASAIDKKAIRDWKAVLTKLPALHTRTKEFRGMDMRQSIAANEKALRPVISSRALNVHLSGMSAFCRWLTTNEYITSNPCTGMFAKKTDDSSARPFTVEEMNKLFASPLFAGCQSDAAWRFLSKPGNFHVRDYRYWLPLVMLYSGARPSEVAQLGIDNVRQEHGHWIMHITDQGDGKRVKTKGSVRVVPVHPELIRLGFIGHFKKMKDAGHTRLFPEATRNARGQMLGDYSREFGKYLTRLGIKDGRGLSLYSFRHGAADALRRAGHLDEQFGFILGHTKATMTQKYGVLPEGMLQQRVDLIDSVAYPGLKLDNLISFCDVI